MKETRRRREAATSLHKRQVSFFNEEITIKRVIPSMIPHPNQPTKPTTQFPPPSKPFTPLSAIKPNFFPTSFADLFKKLSPPPVSKGILPLPPHLKPLSELEEPWIPVTHRRARKPRSEPQKHHQPIPLKKRRCFFCGNLNHMAGECKIGSFLCFRCKEIGHTSRSCPLIHKPQPHPTPVIPLPQSVKDNILKLSNFAVLTLKHGEPSLLELRDMLEYIFNVKEWEESIIPSGKGSFLVEFPSPELLEKAVSSLFVDMGNFGGSFARWSERKGLRVFTEPVFVWVKISSLPYHL